MSRAECGSRWQDQFRMSQRSVIIDIFRLGLMFVNTGSKYVALFSDTGSFLWSKKEVV